MRGNKRLAQGLAVAGATGVLVCSVAFSQPQIMQTEETIHSTRNGAAGIMTAIQPLQLPDDLLEQQLSIEKLDVDTVSAYVPASDLNVWTEKPETRVNVWTQNTKAAKDNAISAVSKKSTSAMEKTAEKEKAVGKEKNAKKAQVESAKSWKNKLMADVEDCLNIRKAPGEDSEVLGKLRRGDAAKVLKKGKNWTKITSGSVTGYVNNEYCVYGDKAYKLAKKSVKHMRQ